MAYFLYGLFFVSCIVLIGAVLLQPGKTDAGALFTSNVSSTAFTPRGAQSVLSKLTIIAATVFMLSALLLSMPALTGNISVLQTTGDSTTSAPVIEADANANTAVDANANTVVDTNTNSNSPDSIAGNANTSAPANTESNANSPVEEKKPETK